MLIPEEKPPTALTIWATTCEGGHIVCKPYFTTGPFLQFMLSGHDMPPEWLERAIPINFDDQEDKPCR